MSLFNLPSISLAESLKNIGEKAIFGWHEVKSVMPSTTFHLQVGNRLPHITCGS